MNKTSSIIITFLILSFKAYSQEFLTLEDAIKIALKNNFGIILSANELQITKNNITLGNAGFLPKLDLSADYSHGISNGELKTVTGQELDINSATSNAVNTNVILKWTLFDGMRMFANYDILKKLETLGELNYKNSIESTIGDIIKAYYLVVKNTKILLSIKAQIEISEYRLNIEQINFETGNSSELELNKAKIDLNFDKSDFEKQKVVLENSKINLNQLLSRNVNTNFYVTDSIPLNQLSDLNEIISEAIQSNTKLKYYKQNKELSILQSEKILANQFPMIDINLGYNYSNLKTDASFINYNLNYGLNFGVSLKYNIFNGFNDKREYENSQIQIYSNEIKINQLELDIQTKISQVYNEWKFAKKIAEFEYENLQIAMRNIEIAKESYSVGSLSSLQMRDIQLDLLKSNVRLAEAEFIAKEKETELYILTGKIIK